MKKICYITTVPMTLKAFVIPAAAYIHDHTDWQISFVCDADPAFAAGLPEYIRYHPIPMKRGISISGLKAIGQMYRLFRRERFDLIQYSTPNASLYAAVAGFLAGVPVRLYCQWGMAYVGFSGVKRELFKWIERLVCGLSTWVEPDSKSNLDFAHSEKLYGPKKGSVVWHGSACGVDLRKFDVSKKTAYRREVRQRCAIGEDAFVFGFVGRITKDKGVNELLGAFRNISREKKNVYLLMVGPDEADENVDQELLQWSRSCGCVLYTGFTNHVEQYLSAMDVYILPSYREGFGTGVIEAEAMELGVIVTDIPGPTNAMIPDVTGLTVAKADEARLEQAMRTMLADRTASQNYGRAGRQLVLDQFDQQKLLGHILADRKKLLNL